MPGKKAARKGGPKRPRRRPTSISPRLKAMAAVAIVAALVAGALLAARFVAKPEPRALTADRKLSPARSPHAPAAPSMPAKARETKPAAPQAAGRSPGTLPAPAPKPQPPAPPAPETDAGSPNALHAALPPDAPELPLPQKPPRVAIIIDDVGYDRLLAEKFIGLNAALTLSILPYSPHHKEIARSAHAQGAEIMLHLPMEPLEYPEVNPGPGALLTSMSPDELLKALDENLTAVPHVKGVNNHMGSKLTAHSEQVYQVFSVLKRWGLFFVDSRTTEASVCLPSARLLQLPFARRDVFLDNVQEPAAIRKQVWELVRLARSRGQAVGIGHAHSSMYNVFKEMLPELRQQIEFVPVSRLVRVIG